MERKVIPLEIIDDVEESGVSKISLVDVPAIDKDWMAFRREEFVNPSKGERQDDFIPRCIAKLVGEEGYETDQAAAICYSTWRETHSAEAFEMYPYPGDPMDYAKVSFDYDDTLSTGNGLRLAMKYKEDGDTLYIISARNTPSKGMLSRAKELGIPADRVFATGSNKDKIAKILELAIDRHIDNNEDVVKELGATGLKFVFAAETYTDYPEAAVNAAKRALEWADKNGWGDCGMGPGKARANQLANREPLSRDTIARMSAFQRHRQNSDTPYGEGCGKLMWDAWGGDAGIAWAERKLKEIDKQEMSYDTGALPAYTNEIGDKKVKMQELPAPAFPVENPADEGGIEKLGYPSVVSLPRGHTIVISAQGDEPPHGLLVTLLETGGYDVKYWYNNTRNVVPSQVNIDGAQVADEAMSVHLGYHGSMPYGQAFAAASGNPGDRPLARIPKEERGRTGSAKNEPGDTKNTRGGIEVSEEVEKSLKDKIEEHNKKNPQETQKATLGMLKAVWRRGAGAYSIGTPGKRDMQRAQWAMARVNSFLNILAGNQSGYDKDYNQDNDLLPKDHPKHSEQKMSKMIFASEDQQIVVGPAMIPDMEIIRKYDEGPDKGKPYWVKFSKEVIKKIAEKFMRELRNHDTNILHDPESDAKSYVMESWIVENPEDKANTVYNMEVPEGTWMVSMRVTDPTVWKSIKAGKLKGFSIEGNFMSQDDYEAYKKDKQLYDRVMKILKSV